MIFGGIFYVFGVRSSNSLKYLKREWKKNVLLSATNFNQKLKKKKKKKKKSYGQQNTIFLSVVVVVVFFF